MPCYNVAAYIAETLRCILSQTWTDWELVIADDGSTDSTPEIVDKLASEDHRIVVLPSEPNSGGAYIPRLRAACAAKGKYVVPIDADDRIGEDFLERLHRSLSRCSADLVIPQMWRFSDGCEPYKILPLEKIDTAAVWEGSHLVRHTLRVWEIPMAGFASERTIYLEAAARITEADIKSMHADELLSRWILCLSETSCFSDASYFYRVNESSVTHNDFRLIESAAITNRGVSELSRNFFGKDSEEYRMSRDRIFLSAVDSLRKINNSKAIKGKDKKRALKIVKGMLAQVTSAELKGRISPRYLALMRLPLPLAMNLLKIIDRVKPRC